MKNVIVLTIAALFAATAHAQMKIAVLSDIHVMAPELVVNDGEAFKDYIAHDRKLLAESPMLLEAAVNRILSQNPDVVLIPGDLTKDGERVSHELVAGKLLKPFRDKGIPVYVVPGNHDVNNPHAMIFDGDTTYRTETVSAEDFATIYSDYGYGSAIARDEHSLSYVAQLSDSLRLLAVDACKYEENSYEQNTCITGGRIKPETMKFIEEQSRKAAADGCKVITIMHHGLIKHWVWQDIAMDVYLVDNWKKDSKRFGKLGLNIVLTGHFHAQDVVVKGKGKRQVYDIETGSTVSYPLPIRFMTWEGNTIEVRSETLCGNAGVAPEIEARSIDYATESIVTIVGDIVAGHGIPEDIVREAGLLVAEAYRAHIRGDENMPSDYPDRLKVTAKKVRKYSAKYAFILRNLARHMYTDLSPSDNNLTIELPE